MMKRLSSLIKKKTFRPKDIDEKTVFFIAKKVIFKEFGAVGQENIFPDKYFKNMLIFKTSGSLWSSEVWLRRSDLKEKINKELGANLIEKIKL